MWGFNSCLNGYHSNKTLYNSRVGDQLVAHGSSVLWLKSDINCNTSIFVSRWRVVETDRRVSCLKMPLLVTDYSWTQTDTTVFIHVPLKAAGAGKVDIVSTDEYLKVKLATNSSVPNIYKNK